NAPAGKRAIYGTFPQLGAPIGFFLSTGLFLVLSLTLSPADLHPRASRASTTSAARPRGRSTRRPGRSAARAPAPASRSPRRQATP
ncbi:hypothetical protein, partial [Clavibacter michiganensis]|uniref:hypothetical protein n=1 Tax=Clavibacter michiganensis TaxID=28447 RepID=UPI001F4D6CDA